MKKIYSVTLRYIAFTILICLISLLPTGCNKDEPGRDDDENTTSELPSQDFQDGPDAPSDFPEYSH